MKVRLVRPSSKPREIVSAEGGRHTSLGRTLPEYMIFSRSDSGSHCAISAMAFNLWLGRTSQAVYQSTSGGLMARKVALVTGANRGIGLETVRQLAGKQITVLLGARDESKGSAAAAQLRGADLDVQPLQIDVDDPVSHVRAADSIADKFGKLDILINNAGVFLDQPEASSYVPASRTDMAIFRKTFETNFFNTIAVTQALLPLVKKSDAGRIVFLSSILGSLTMHSDPKSPIYGYLVPAYDASKTALNAYVVHLAEELKATTIKVNAAHPGSVQTDMNRHGELSVEEGARTSVALATLPADGMTGKLVYMGQVLPW